MKANEVEALSRILSESTNGELSIEDARETVNDFLPEFVNQYIQSPKVPSVQSQKDFHIGPKDNKRAAFFLGQAKQKYNLPVQDEYVAQNVNDADVFKKHENDLLHAISHEKQVNNAKMGKPLENILIDYASSNKIKAMKEQYTGKNDTIEPNQNSTPEQLKAHEEYLKKVDRAARILDYLNDNNINARVDVDNKNPSELAAYLPEYNNTKVTIMSDNPQNIGKVNTWNNIVSFSRKVDATKLPPETLIDTVVNPDVQLEKADPLHRKYQGPQFTSIHRADLPNAEIFTTSTSRVIKSMREFVSSAKEEAQNAIASKNMSDIESTANQKDSTGLEDEDDTSLDITPEDKVAEITKRAKNDFKPINTLKDAKHEQEIHGLFSTIYKQGKALGLSDMQVYKNSEGVYKYTYNTINPKTKQKTPGYGIIGGYIPPEKDGTNKIVINGKLKGYSVPGMRAYINTKTGDLTVKRFNSILREKVRQHMVDQLLNPDLRGSVKSYGALDTLYTTDSYSSVVQLGVNSPEYEKALIKTLRNRIRLSNEVVEVGNSFLEDDAQKKTRQKKDYRNVRQTMISTQDMRTIPEKWQNIVDREMTGIGKTMGTSLFIGDDVTINRDGTLTPNPETKHTESALHKLDLFKWNKYDPADRNIMAFNQAIRNVPIDQNVNVAMMTMSGYTENDAALITAKYAQNHQIMGEDGKMRPLKRGDKITDFHGNKSTISEVIDPNEKDPERRKKLAKEIAIVKANPDLDVVVNPYSSISRLNTGSVHEMQDRGGMSHLHDATYVDENGKKQTIPLSHITMGKETYAVAVGQKVDEKTKIYDHDSYISGKARNFSHQLAMAAASAGLPKTLNYVYSHNMNPGWAKFMDDLHVLGYDVDKDHHIGNFDYNSDKITKLKMPDKDSIEKNVNLSPKGRIWAHQHQFKDALRSAIMEAKTKKGPIVMELPEEYENAAKQKTNKVVIPYEQIKADAILHKRIGAQDSKSTSIWLNEVHQMYDYAAGIQLDKKQQFDKNGKPKLTEYGHYEYKDEYAPEKASKLAKTMINQIISKDFGSKKNIVKSEIYSAPMQDSATAVVTPDPNLDIDTIAVGEDIYNNLHLTNPNESVVVWRDPILRDGGFRLMHVVKDKTLTGVGINPVDDKSMDMDHDGDTVAVVPMHDKEVQEELEKMRPSRNLLMPIAKEPESYLETGLELQGSLYRQNDLSAQSDLANPRKVTPDLVRSIIKKGFQNKEAYGIGLDLTDKDTYLNGIENLIKSGAKGHYLKDVNGNMVIENGHIVSDDLKNVEHYYDGKRNDEDMKEFMQGLAIKVDGVGPAGKVQQNLMYALRNVDPKDAMDLTQLSTQIILQAKHNAGGKAVKNEHAVLTSIPNVIQGHKEDANRFSHYQLTPKEFESEVDKVYNKEMGMNVASAPIERLAMNLTGKDGKIMTKGEREEIADPIDLIAYSGDSVVSTLNNAIASDTPIATGKYTKQFAMPEELLSDHVLGREKDAEKQADADKNMASLDETIEKQQAAEKKAYEDAHKPNEVQMSDDLKAAMDKIMGDDLDNPDPLND